MNYPDKQQPHKTREIHVGHYKILRILGEGTFGKVKLCTDENTHEKYAVKILEKRKIKEKDDQIRVDREINMIKTFNHPNLISVSEIFFFKDSYYIVMDYCEGGELFNYIVKHRRLDEDEAAFFYYQIIEGLEYIHHNKIAHRDLKPENLLLTRNKTLKIIDFGLSNYFDEKQLLSTPCGSPCYASPEMVSGKKYNGFQIDIWSTGIILYAMLCGYLPFEDKNNDVLFKKILKCKYELPSHIRSRSKDLMKRILVTNPNERITIPEIKRHPFYLHGKELFNRTFNPVVHNVMAKHNVISSRDSLINSKNAFYKDNNLYYNALKTEEDETQYNTVRKSKKHNFPYQQQLLVPQKEEENLAKSIINEKEFLLTPEHKKTKQQNEIINHKTNNATTNMIKHSLHKVINTEPNLPSYSYRTSNTISTHQKMPTQTQTITASNTTKPQSKIGTILKMPNKYSYNPYVNYTDTVTSNTMRLSTKPGVSVQKTSSNNDKGVTINNKTINNTVINFNLYHPNVIVDMQKRSKTKPKLTTSRQSQETHTERQRNDYTNRYLDILSRGSHRSGGDYVEHALKTQEQYTSYLNKYKNDFINGSNNYATITQGNNNNNTTNEYKKHLKMHSMKLQSDYNSSNSNTNGIHGNYLFNNNDNIGNSLTSRYYNGINPLRYSMRDNNRGKGFYLKDLLNKQK